MAEKKKGSDPKGRGTMPTGTEPGARGTDREGPSSQSKTIAVGPRAKPAPKTKAIAVWASARDVPTVVCFDARLGGKPSDLSYPNGTTKGQAGWDMSFVFKNLDDLAVKLTRNPIETPGHVCGKKSGMCAPIQRGQIARLAINAHGLAAGKVFFNGQRKTPITPHNIEKHHKALEDIGLAVREHNGIILLAGCLAGLGKDGTKLLKSLSQIWSGCKVVGFVTIGFAWGGEMSRTGSKCAEPGMRATKHVFSGGLDPRIQNDIKRLWKDLEKLPWAWEDVRIPHKDPKGKVHLVSPVKIAKDGNIIQGKQL